FPRRMLGASACAPSRISSRSGAPAELVRSQLTSDASSYWIDGLRNADCAVHQSPSVLLLAPREEGVVHRQLRGELPLVVVVRQAEALRDGHEPARLRGEVALVSIRAADDEREALQSWLLLRQTVAADYCVEGAFVAVVTELGACDVVRRGTLALRDGFHLVARYVQELGFGIDEPLDEPRTCDPIHLRSFTSYPFHPVAPFGIGVRRRSSGIVPSSATAYRPAARHARTHKSRRASGSRARTTPPSAGPTLNPTFPDMLLRPMYQVRVEPAGGSRTVREPPTALTASVRNMGYTSYRL